ncbi:uncharacterized protein STEHIDRAFT_33397, partial [Stereum hirsutum FP-91666 SS1]|uniref:uncharacterized protein n=1 Tax=Stereum hirsutum (strain FP-91666) TaxID=721885 RepID=UPI000440D88B
IFDWLRILYARMAYIVRVNGELSEAFQSTIGVLTGDTGSPFFWILFMADLRIPVQPGDIRLAGRSIPDVEHADDCAVWGTVRPSVQHHLDHFSGWTRRKGLLTNVPKTKSMCFGPLPTPSLAEEPFTFDGEDVEWVSKHKYTGITVTSTERDIFTLHYREKGLSAQRVANVCFAAESMVGSIPPREARILYLARVDPFLISACDVIIDICLNNLWNLEKVQIRYIRRLLHLRRRSMYHVLYSETGLMPLRYRRLILALRFLRYLVLLPQRHYARCAFDDSLDLARTGRSGWVGDLAIALGRLDHPVHFDFMADVTVEVVDGLIEEVEASSEHWVRAVIDNSPKTWLLKDRVEITKNGKTDTSAILFRHYLHMIIPSHRFAFVDILLSNHSLAIEMLRWQSRERPYYVPREWRLCRFCVQVDVHAVEDETHAILQC